MYTKAIQQQNFKPYNTVPLILFEMPYDVYLQWAWKL